VPRLQPISRPRADTDTAVDTDTATDTDTAADTAADTDTVTDTALPWPILRGLNRVEW
jgi:hypothetical protein